MADDGRRRDWRRALRMAALMLCASVPLVATGSARGDPPPWTDGERNPADRQIAYRFPAGLKDGRCRPGMFDSAMARGLVEGGRSRRSTPGLRRDRHGAIVLGGTAIGKLLAAVGGNRSARGISREDEICFSQSFEHAPDGSTVAWLDRRLAVHYSVIPLRTLKTSDGRYCRDYAAKATLNGHAADVYGTACRQPDGNWLLVD